MFLLRKNNKLPRSIHLDSHTSCTVKHKVQYRKQGTTTWTSKFATTTSYTIAGLTANTTYEYRVETFCSSSGSSNSGYTTIQTFTTTLRMGSDLTSLQQIISIYPNPAKDSATISFTLSQSSHVSVKLYDVRGKGISTLLNDDLQAGDHSIQLSIAAFAKGVYLVKMISDEGIANQKLVIH